VAGDRGSDAAAAFELLHVAAADAAGFDAHQRVVLTDAGTRQLAQLMGARTGLDGSADGVGHGGFDY
jgi:hypothetical protein